MPGVFLLIVLIAFVLFVWKRTKIAGEHILFALPVAREMMQEVELSRMGHALGSLVQAGMDIPQALRYLQESTPITLYRRF